MEGGEEVGRDGDTLAAAEPLLAEKGEGAARLGRSGMVRAMVE